jgi:hypothetical protein
LIDEEDKGLNSIQEEQGKFRWKMKKMKGVRKEGSLT